MKKIDIYNSYLRLTNRISENSTPISNLDQISILTVYKQQQCHHPDILNGLRNKNSQSYKTLCSPSKIFYPTDTPDIIQNVKNKYEASERKRQIELNYQSIINPSFEKIISTQQSRISQNRRYNVLLYLKRTKRLGKLVLKNDKISILKLIYLPTKYKQLMVRNNMESLKHIKNHNLLRLSLINRVLHYNMIINNNNNYEDRFRHLLTSYSKANQIKVMGRNIILKIDQFMNKSNIVEQQVLKPYNKVFQQSQNEQYIKQNKKGQGDQFYNQQKSIFKIY